MIYSELKVWKETRKLVGDVYSVTKGFPKEEFDSFLEQTISCKKMLNGFINYYKSNLK